MNKIVVYRSHIEINDYNLGDKYYLEKKFSIYNKLYFRWEPKGMIYIPETKTLMLPRGTDILSLEREFGCEAVVDYTTDPIRSIGPVGLKYTPRDQDQIEAIKFMLGMDKYRINQHKTMLSLNLNTGKGKSYCAIATIAYAGYASAIITDTNGCLEQWAGYITEYTNIEREDIFHISGSPSIAKLFRMPPDRYKIYLVSHATLKSYGDKYGWDKIHELFCYLGIGMKFYDEAHLDFANMMAIDSFTNTYKTYYLTATLARSNNDEDVIFQVYFNGVPSIDLFDSEIDPHTAYVGIKYNSAPSAAQITECNNAYGLNRINYTNYVVQQENFHSILHILIDMARKKPGKCLWYIGTNQAIVYVRDWIYENYPELTREVGIYTSATPKEIRKQQLEKKIILSTTKSAGAAMDIKGLTETVNLAEPFKSKVLAQQTLGRTRAKDTIYKDIVDLGFPQTRAYFNAKKPVFMKYATSCKEVILKPAELKERERSIVQNRRSLMMPVTFEDDREDHKGELNRKYYEPVIFE